MDLLQTTLCLPTCPEQLQLLCAAILREMSPCDSLSLCCDHIQNTRQLSLVASVLLAQVTQLSPLRLATLPLVPLGPREKRQAGVQSLRAGSAWVPSAHQFLRLPQVCQHLDASGQSRNTCLRLSHLPFCPLFLRKKPGFRAG